MSAADDLEHRIKKLCATTKAETDKHILDDAFVELESSARTKVAASGWGVFLRTIRNRTRELVAVAASVLIIFALFFSSPAAKAVTLAEIYEALEKVRNVCTLSFQTGRREPYSTIWISRLMRVWLMETKKSRALWDLQSWTKKILDKSINDLSEESIQPDMRQKYEDSLLNSFGLMPFSDKTAVKEDVEWNHVDDETITASIPDTEVYDLTWSKVISETTTEYYKWRVFVDIKTNLPVRSEWYQKHLNHVRESLSDDDFVLETFTVVTYPTDTEILDRIEEMFGKEERQKIESDNLNNPEATQININ